MSKSNSSSTPATPLIKKSVNDDLSKKESCFRPYAELMRVHKPTGGILFFWPFAWGLTMAAYEQKIPYNTYFTLLCEFAFGAFIVRGSACTVNDIFDREFDAAVERTKNRPLASGRVSVFAAWIFFIIQILIGTAFFAMFNRLAFWAGMFQMLPMLCLYPLMKRITYWPQAWLGIAINFSMVFAWLTVSEILNTYVVFSLLAASWCWTMVYDTIYGCQDRKDDVKAGVKSTALLFGDHVMAAVTCFAIGFVALLAYAGASNRQGLPYYAVSVVGVALHLVWQLTTVDLDSPASCWLNFKRNGHQVGLLVMMGMLLDYIRIKGDRIL